MLKALSGITFLILLTYQIAEGARARCAVCGMPFAEVSKTSFLATKDGKSVPFCSFSCANRFHKKYPKLSLHAVDFESKERIEVQSSFFLIRSRNILKEIEAAMPPTIIAFKSKKGAMKKQSILKDGEVVKGYEGLEKAFQ